ncbi:MAG: hypothetical protein WKF75_17905 [Singulisphaera sp.]
MRPNTQRKDYDAIDPLAARFAVLALIVPVNAARAVVIAGQDFNS